MFAKSLSIAAIKFKKSKIKLATSSLLNIAQSYDIGSELTKQLVSDD